MPSARMTIPISSPPRLLLANCSSSITPATFLRCREISRKGPYVGRVLNPSWAGEQPAAHVDGLRTRPTSSEQRFEHRARQGHADAEGVNEVEPHHRQH